MGRGGFSLVEVVIAIAIVALAIPVMIGMFSFFSKSSADAMNREEAARTFTAISLFLNGNAPDATTGNALVSSHGDYFASVLYWVQNPGAPTLVYAYKAPAIAGAPSTTGGYLVSLTAPAQGTWSGPLMVGSVKPIPNFVASFPTPYTKAYVQAEVAVYALSTAKQALPSTPIDTYPAVIMR